MAMINAYTGQSSTLSEEERALIARREAALGPAYRLFYQNPVHFVRGEGSKLYDADGNAYLDAYNNVASVGHSNPRVVEAIAKQAAILNTHTRYLNEVVIGYAERLLSKFPRELAHVMFTCTGSEANDLAVRVAKSYTGGTGFIVTELAYHGVTDAVSQMSPSLGKFVNLGEHVRTVPAPDSFRVPVDELGAYFARGVHAAIADMERHGIKPAAMIVDTIFSSDGVFVDPKGFLRDAVAEVQKAGALFIADEVQPGFGRTGDALWGFERHGLKPDMVSLGKPMGNGHPIAGLVLRHDVIDNFGRNSRYFNTFGGNPVSCAAGMAVLDVIEQQELQQNAKAVGAYLADNLRALAKRHPEIADVRGAGLFLGVEIIPRSASIAADALTTKVVNGLRERRVLISATGPRANVLKIRPPLVFSKADADTLTQALEEVLKTP